MNNTFKDTRDMNGEYEGEVDNSLVNKAYHNAYPSKKDEYIKKNTKTDSKEDPYYNKPVCYVVDGYNLMFSIEELNELSKTNFSSARDKVIDLLCNFKAIIKGRLIVVFDAYKEDTDKKDYFFDGINIVFTKKGQLADTYIENLVKDLVKDYKVTVISSDILEQELVFAHGGLRMSCESFIKITNEKLEMAYHNYNNNNKAYINRPLEELEKLNR